jgi:hypothetical protein
MAEDWKWDQDRQWSHSPWRKEMNTDNSKIRWNLEVRTSVKRRLMGELVISGHADGELYISLARLDEDPPNKA